MSFRSDRRSSGDGRSYGGGRSSGAGRSGGGGRPYRTRFEREGRSDRDNRSDRAARFDRDDRFDRGGRGERTSRSTHKDRFDRDGRFDRKARPGRGDRFDRASRFDRDSASGGDRRYARSDRSDRGNRFGREDQPSNGGRFSKEGSFNRDNRFASDSRSERASGSARGGRFQREDRFSSQDRFNRSNRPGGDRSARAGSSGPERFRGQRQDGRVGARRSNWHRDEARGSFDQASSQGEDFAHSPDAQADDMLWGRHATQAALEAGRPIHRIWCTPEVRSSPKFLQLLREAKASGVLVEEVTWARLGQLTGGAVHQGIALQTASAETLDLPSLVEGCAALGEPPLLLALDGLTDPHNLGAIVRSAEALGAHGVVLPQRRSAGLTGSVAKVAAGALEHLPVARVVNLNRSLETLKDAGYRVVGLAEEGDVTLPEADLDGPLVVVTGSEGQGLSLLTRRHCDQLIRIPLRGVTPSLNASVATAMCLYEVARRGWMKDLKGQAPSPPIVRPRCGALATAAGHRSESVQIDEVSPAPAMHSSADSDAAVELQPEIATPVETPDLALGLDPTSTGATSTPGGSFNDSVEL